MLFDIVVEHTDFASQSNLFVVMTHESCIKQAGLRIKPSAGPLRSVLSLLSLFWCVYNYQIIALSAGGRNINQIFPHVKHCRLRNTSGHSKWESWCEAFKARHGTKHLGLDHILLPNPDSMYDSAIAVASIQFYLLCLTHLHTFTIIYHFLSSHPPPSRCHNT